MVGAVGFELTTYWSQTSCATRLRYAPKPQIVCGALAHALKSSPDEHRLSGRAGPKPSPGASG